MELTGTQEADMDNAEKTRENRARRAAQRQGLRLEKNPRRDPLAKNYGQWRITRSNRPVAGGSTYTLTLDAVEQYLASGGQR